MTDPFWANVLAGIIPGVLSMLGPHLRELIKGTPREQALIRCYQAATSAFLPEDDPTTEQYRPILRDFLAEPAVQAEMAKLVKGRQPDQVELEERFGDICRSFEDLPEFDFPSRLAASIEAFLDTAELEPELAGIIQTANLRDIAESLMSDIAPNVKGIRRILEQGDEPTTIPIPQNAPPSIKQAIKVLDSTNPYERKDAVNTIAQSDDPIAFEVLLSVMCDHPTKEVRGSALDALLYRDHSDKRVIPALIKMLGDDWGFHTIASSMLADFGKSALPDLLNALQHENPKIRYGAAMILGDIGEGDQIAQSLIEALRDTDGNVRWAAAVALGKLKEPAAVLALAEVLSDTERPEWAGERVRDAADQALRNIGTPEAMDARKKHFG